MSLPEKVAISTSKLTAIGEAIRSRFGVSGDLTLDEMATTVTSHLPSGFQQVEYIQSSGTQYIDTGVPITSDLRMVLERANIDIDEGFEGAIFNDDSSVSIFTWGYNSNLNNKYSSLIGSNPSAWISSNVSADTEKHIFDLSNGSQKIDGVEYGTQTIQPYLFAIGLFAWHMREGWNERRKARVYSCKFYNGDTLIRDFIPCYRKSDNEIGLYDIINGQFYTNSGSGSFTCYPAPN